VLFLAHPVLEPAPSRLRPRARPSLGALPLLAAHYLQGNLILMFTARHQHKSQNTAATAKHDSHKAEKKMAEAEDFKKSAGRRLRRGAVGGLNREACDTFDRSYRIDRTRSIICNSVTFPMWVSVTRASTRTRLPKAARHPGTGKALVSLTQKCTGRLARERVAGVGWGRKGIPLWLCPYIAGGAHM
jgi:hypothetical protein